MNSRGVTFYSEQLSQLEAELVAERAKISPEETESIAIGRLNQAESFLREGVQYCGQISQGDPNAAPEMIRALISCQVELDYLRSPEVDPFVGWITTGNDQRVETGTYTLVDTQLYRAYVDHQSASVVSFQYKPRKLDLMAGVWEGGGVLSTSQRLFEPSAKEPINADTAARLIVKSGFETSPKDPKVETKIKTKDLVRIHASSSAENGAIKECRDILFKAGIGAHLANATTGFSIEHWVESKNALASQMLCLQLNLGLPTRDINLISTRTLTAFGGTSERANQQLARGTFIKSADEPAGVHGVRLIDGLGTLILDIRSAKPLNALSVTPDYSAGEPEAEGGQVVGLILQFFIDARRILADDKANTVFISIT